jgi:hypothetical protein
MVTDVKLEQLENAFSPMLVTELGIVTLTKLPAFALPAKKLFGIEVTFVD